MLGLLFPFGGIAVGGLVGLLFRRWIRPYNDVLRSAVGLCVAYLGVCNALASDDFLGILLCVFLGTWAGELLKLDDRAVRLSGRLTAKLPGGGDAAFPRAFVTTSVLFCLGPLPLLGPLEAAAGDGWGTLLDQTAMDAMSAVVFAAALGAGVLFSACSVLVYESAIFFLSELITPWLTDPVLTHIYAVGGIMTLAAGLGMALPQLKLRVTNMIPALILAVAYALVCQG